MWGQAFFENPLVQLIFFSGMIYMGYSLLMQPPTPTSTEEHKERIGQIVIFLLLCGSFGFCQEANRRKAKMSRAFSSSDMLANDAEQKEEKGAKND